ncbi:MAG: ATP-binding protein [Nannocystaceae bacterium]|nr:ATP-binding protein [bacterium]
MSDTPQPSVSAADALRTLPRPVMTFAAVRDEAGALVDLRWVTSNEKACALVGREESALLGRRLLEEMPGNRDSGLFEAYAAVVETGTPHRRTLRYDYDGFDHWFEIRAERVGDGVVVLFEDVTERRRVEEERDQARRRMNEAFQGAPFPVLLVRAETKTLVSANDSARSIFTKPSATLGAVVDFFDALVEPEAVAKLIERAIASGEVETLSEQRFRGAKRYTNLVAKRVGTGDLVEVIAADVSDQVTARKEAQRASRQKSQVLAVLGHELRNPLGAMSTAVEVLGAVASSPQTLERVRGTMRRQIELSTQLLENILDVTRIEHGKLALNPARGDVCEVLQRAVADVQLRQTKDLELVETWPAEPIEGVFDATRLYQIGVNLVSNAFKYTPAGRVCVSLRVEGSHAVFVVEDTGLGIPEDHLESIFETFEQVHASDGREGGLGLGLALVAKLAQMHDGEVKAFSEGEGKGSRFVLRLPLAGS